MMASCVACGARDLGGEAAFGHHEDAVAERQQLGQLGGDEEDGAALRGELADHVVELGLDADVDAARRLVEDEDRRVGEQPAGEDRLLLVAAGELADRLAHRGEADAELLGRVRGERLLERAADEAARRDLAGDRGGDVLLDREGAEDAGDGAVLGHEGEAEGDGVVRRR